MKPDLGSLDQDTDRLIELYPKIFFACHTRHVRDPETERVVSARQAQILDHLDDTDSISVSGLAGHMGVTASTMSLALDRLETAGYVRRVPDAQDRRRVGVRLTRAGVRVRDAHSVLEPDRVRAMLTALEPDVRDRALDGVAVLAEAAVHGLRPGPYHGLAPVESASSKKSGTAS